MTAETISQYFITIILIMACIQGDMRRPSAVLFASTHFFFGFFMTETNGYTSYHVGAAVDVIIIIGLAQMPITQLTKDLIRASTFSMFLNGICWVMWGNRASLLPYDIAYFSLYIWVIIRLTRDEGIRYGDKHLDWWANCLRLNNA